MANDIVVQNPIQSMTESDIAKVRQFEKLGLELPQLKIETQHIFHAGMYSRTIMMPAGSILTGALIKIATTIIVCGNVTVYIGGKTLDLNGYFVIPASANRKQAFKAISDTYITMMFATDAKTVEDAEEEITDEAHLLFSRKSDYENKVIVTGE